MPNRASPTRSTAAAKSKRQPHGRKPVAKAVPVVADVEDVVETAPAARGATTVKISNGLAAAVVGLKERQLTNLRGSGCPVPDGGVRTVDQIAAIVRWRMDQLRASMAHDGEDGDDLDREDKRTSLKAKQLKLAKELDLVLDGDEYFHHLSTLWVEMNSLLDAMGTQLGPMVAPLTDEADCTDRIDAFVADLKKRFNPEEAMNPIRVELDPFTDDEVGIDLEDDGDAGDDEH